MILRLVWRSLVQRPGRSALLLAGYALGVGVTVALLSIGAALVEQARDRELVGGGDLVVLPAGLDLETLKTGGVSSLYFTVEQAPFLYRQVLAGPRFGDRVAAAAPWIDDELLYLEVDGRTRAVSAGGRIPSLSRALGVRPELVAGRWSDHAADRRWRAPGDSALYAGLDRFHLPSGAAAGDSTWAEWHYFNVLFPAGAGPATGDGGAGAADGDRGPAGWLYLTYMVTGAVPDGRWGGRLLATLVTPRGPDRGGDGGTGAPPGSGPDGPHGGDPDRGPASGMRVRSYEARVPAREVAFSLVRPDLEIGRASVRLDSAGAYRLRARVPPGGGGRGPSAADDPGAPGASSAEGADVHERDGGPPLQVELVLRPHRRRHLPPLEIGAGDFASGYTVPVMEGRASGRVCVGDRCRRLRGARAYHDHNWGVWRAVTWDWGQAHAGPVSAVWGGVRRDAAGAGARPGAAGGRRFLFLADSLGFLGLLPLDSLDHAWTAARGPGGTPRPRRIGLRASRGSDTIRLRARADHVRATDPGRRGRRVFYQMQGTARLRGRVLGRELRGRGPGFFETWRSDDRGRPWPPPESGSPGGP